MVHYLLSGMVKKNVASFPRLRFHPDVSTMGGCAQGESGLSQRLSHQQCVGGVVFAQQDYV
jgi:hypothetical protein